LVRRLYDIVLLIVAVWHVAALLSLSPPTSNPWSLVPMVLGAVVFVCAISFHPGKIGHSSGHMVTWARVFKSVPHSEKKLFVAVFVYSFGATFISVALGAQKHGGWDGVPREAVGPIGDTALALWLAATGWIGGRSGINLKRKLIAQGMWFGR
jgi:hypothetical protein